MENNYFDKIIRAKLENLEASKRAEGWELLQHRMNADPELNTPNDAPDPIDDIVKSKLEDTTASYEPGSWALMESMINADADLSIPEMEDVVLDGIAYENLNTFETPYNPAHWELMARRIQEEFSLQHRLYRYKIAEISLMLFAIFTLLQFLPIHKIALHKKGTPVAKTESPATFQQAATPSIADYSINQNEETVSTATTEDAAANSSNQLAPVTNNNSTLAQAETKPNTETASTDNYEIPPVNIINHTGTSINENLILLAASTEDESLPQDENEENVSDETVSSLANQTNQADEASKHSDMSLLLLETESIEELVFDDSKNLPNCTYCKGKKPINLRIGMMTALDFNYVMTPYDVKFERDAYANLYGGYSGGFSFGFQQGRWELGTGVLYSSKRYEPEANIEYTGSLLEGLVGEGLTSAQLNILSIPLNVNYTYAYAGKWHFYSVAGASANLLAINHYDEKTFSVSSRNGYGDPRIQQQHGEPTYDGILEGGKLSDNIYLTVNLGLGVERYFTPRWSIFVQPVYQHSILSGGGIGPNSDRINALSIFAGAKATLR